jgi:signal recognition particle subunit SRP19
MSHARIEEVSDSDLDSDPSEGDIDDVGSDFDESEILKARTPATGPRPSQVPPPNPASTLINPSQIPSTTNTSSSKIRTDADGTQFHTTEDDSKYKDFQCVYPIYFDKNRSRKEGRRVGVEMAVENPLAREIVAACGKLRLETLFEPTKIHPKDWANPGRVKIKVKGGLNKNVKNSASYFHWQRTIWKVC